MTTQQETFARQARVSSATLTKALAFGLAVVFTSSANAAIVTQWSVGVNSTFNPTTVIDSNGNSPGDVIISNSNRTLRWGDSGQSGLDITNSPVTTTVDTSVIPNLFPPVGNVFVTHTNEPIQGTTLDKVSLQNELSLQALAPAGISQPPVALNFLIEFQETTNGDDICADGGANGIGVHIDGCGDIFVIGDDALNFSFTYDSGDGDDQEYFISFVEVTGGLQSLSADACLSATGNSDPCLGFITPEQATTSFQFGTIISTKELEIAVPTPGMLSLFGLSLVALAGARRRRFT